MTPDDIEDGVNVLINFEHDLTMVRIVENIFLASHVSIKAEVMPLDDAEDVDYEIAFAKVRFWLENIVTRCIAFCKSNVAARSMLIDENGHNNSGNLIMLCPMEPSDENLAVLLQAKMTALGGGKIMFGSIDIKSNNLTGLRFTFIGNASDLLPDIANWIGPNSYFARPWWDRDDASTLDVVPADDADLSVKPEWAYDLDFIAKAIRPVDDVVLRPAFNPTVIDGGRKDE